MFDSLGDHKCIKCCYSNIHQGININLDAETRGTSPEMGWDCLAVWVIPWSNDNIYLCECSQQLLRMLMIVHADFWQPEVVLNSPQTPVCCDLLKSNIMTLFIVVDSLKDCVKFVLCIFLLIRKQFLGLNSWNFNNTITSIPFPMVES